MQPAHDTPPATGTPPAPKPSPSSITLDHIRQAAEWAQQAAARDVATPIDGLPITRRYNQGHWDCGTSCCMWGAAALIAGCDPVAQGPPREWTDGDVKRTAVYGLLRSGTTTPEQMLSLLTGADLTGADLTGADLAGADLAGADLARAHLAGAHLTDALLTDANLAGAHLAGANLTRADLAGAHIWTASGKLYLSHTPPATPPTPEAAPCP
jgi:hypothetical protein